MYITMHKKSVTLRKSTFGFLSVFFDFFCYEKKSK